MSSLKDIRIVIPGPVPMIGTIEGLTSEAIERLPEPEREEVSKVIRELREMAEKEDFNE